MNLIFLGAPGAGKGTQAEVVSEQFHIPTVSTGNIIREALNSGTELGSQAKSFMESGALVPDDIVIGIIKERLAQEDCREGFILDGFPRTIPQAEALERMGIRIDRVIDIEVADDVIAERVSGRRVCGTCGASYHVEYKRPASEGVCDKCGGTLIQREDDRPETVRERLKVYHAQTEPLKSFYEREGKLCIIPGQQEVKDTSRLVLAALRQEEKA